jgi:hypothetical protein
MRVEMVSIWMSKVCRNGALESQILNVFCVFSSTVVKLVSHANPKTSNRRIELCLKSKYNIKPVSYHLGRGSGGV